MKRTSLIIFCFLTFFIFQTNNFAHGEAQKRCSLTCNGGEYCNSDNTGNSVYGSGKCVKGNLSGACDCVNVNDIPCSPNCADEECVFRGKPGRCQMFIVQCQPGNPDSESVICGCNTNSPQTMLF